MKPMIIKPVHTRCSVTMCSNVGTNQIARTSGPGSNAVCICDECLMEAARLRFGDFITGNDATTMRMNADSHMKHIEVLKQLNKVQKEKIILLENEIEELKSIASAAPEEQSVDRKTPVRKGTGRK